MAESVAKRARTASSAPAPAPLVGTADGPLIGTHNGHFHADEALAVHMLRLLPAYRDARLVRTRDAAVLAGCHTVVDVGGEYDAARHRYDHHQRGFTTTFPGRGTKLSSAGLVFLHFGRDIVAQRLGPGVAADAPEVALLQRALYVNFVEALDAHDNGIAVYDPAAVAAAGLERRFADGGFTLAAAVGRLNPNWNDAGPADPRDAQRAEDERFLRASSHIGAEFDRDLDYYAAAWLPARAVVERAFARRRDASAAPDADGRVLVLDGQSVPWKDHLFELEREEAEAAAAAAAPAPAQVLYVLYRERPDPGAKWRIQCVPESKDSFVSRKPLPEAWRGFRDDELDAIAAVPGCVFVHAAGFIGGNKTYEGVRDMAIKALAA